MNIIRTDTIKEKALDLGADVVGITRSGPVKAWDKFQDWLHKGYAGDMTYLTRFQAERRNPETLFPGAKSIIVLGLNYFPHDEDISKSQKAYRVARYAWGEDYHRVFRRILRRLRSYLKDIDKTLNGRICVDTAPFTDKYWAQQAGLGWIGKHSNLISRQFGSWLLLGSLIINVKVDTYDQPHPDHCGNCTACLNSCPTKAFPDEYILDANRCISYWTIESKADAIPKFVGDNLNRYIFGCDICLSACPFNRFQKPHRTEAFRRRQNIDLLETGQAKELSKDEFASEFRSSPVYRPSLPGIKRNISAAQTER